MPPSPLQPMLRHRGGLILTLGILSFILCFPVGPACGVLAWILGTRDLRAMRSGTMDPTGRGSTETGRILGVIGTVLVCALVMVWFAYVVLVLIAAGAAARG